VGDALPFIFRIVRDLHFPHVPNVKRLPQERGLDPGGGFTPTNSTLTDILWCNSDSLYKGERRRKAEALVVQ
jgi:hypothetical protein